MLWRNITFGLILIGGGLIVYSALTANMTLMIIGGGFVVLPILALIPSMMMEAKEDKIKLRTDYNNIIDLIKEDKLKEAYNKIEAEIHQQPLKMYITGVVVGKTLKGDELDDIKLDME